MNSEGHLIIPTQEEIAKACPVTLSDEQEKEFASWRVEFPRPAAAAVGATEEGGGADGSAEAGSSGAGNTQGSAGGGATPPTLAPGTQADSEAALKDNFGDEILFLKPPPDGGAAATHEMALCLTATQAAVGAQKTWRV